MTLFNIRTQQDAPPNSREILAEIEDMAGFVPNVFGLIAESPVALAAIHSMNGFFNRSSFTRQEQEIIALSTSVQNECGYCVAGHSTFATAVNVDVQAIADVRQERPLADHKLNALRDFVALMVSNRGDVSSEAVERFVSAGYAPEQVFELIIGIATKTVTNFASKLARIPVDDEFSAHAWSKAPEVSEPASTSTHNIAPSCVAVGG